MNRMEYDSSYSSKLVLIVLVPRARAKHLNLICILPGIVVHIHINDKEIRSDFARNYIGKNNHQGSQLFSYLLWMITWLCILRTPINSLRPSDAYMRQKLIMIGSDNGLSPGRCRAIIWISAGILLTGPLRTNLIDILIKTDAFSFKKIRLQMSSWKWRPFSLSLNVLKRLSIPTCPG